MTPKYSVGALFGALMLAASFWSYPANALTFQFSFNNNSTNDPGQSLVQGIISGLQDNTANQAALSVQVTSNPAGFGLGEYVLNPPPFFNLFTVSGGVLTDINFLSFGSLNTPATCCTLGLNLPGPLAGLRDDPNSVQLLGTNIIFGDPPSVPLPAALPLFATGLGAMGLLAWRRKRKNAALAA